MFIIFVGPPITSTVEINALTLLPNTSTVNKKDFLSTGAFIMKTPLLTTYSQQLWVIARLKTDNSDGILLLINIYIFRNWLILQYLQTKLLIKVSKSAWVLMA